MEEKKEKKGEYALVECPVCHGKPILSYDDRLGPTSVIATVACERCGFSVKRHPLIATKEKSIARAVEDWNSHEEFKSKMQEKALSVRKALVALELICEAFKESNKDCKYPKCFGCKLHDGTCEIKDGWDAIKELQRNPTWRTKKE